MRYYNSTPELRLTVRSAYTVIYQPVPCATAISSEADVASVVNEMMLLVPYEARSGPLMSAANPCDLPDPVYPYTFTTE